MRTAIFVIGRLLLLATVAVQPGAGNRRYDHHLLGTSMSWPEPYVPRSVIHSRFQMTRNGHVFVTSPRFRPGVPFTLGTFRATSATRAVVEPDVVPLPPVPRTHRIDGSPAACDDDSPPPLVNVIDLYMDRTKDVLWLLDVGVVDTMTNGSKRVAPAKIVRLDIDEEESKNYKTYDIKMDALNEDNTANMCLQYIVTFQSRRSGGGHYAFVSDAGRSSVLVLETRTGDQWSIEYPEHSISNNTTRDVMFMLTLRSSNGRTGLYTTFLSGCRMFLVDLESIDQCTATVARPAIVEVGRKPYRITVLGSDTGSRMYFRRPSENEIWSWDVNNPFHPVSFVLESKGRDCRAPVHVSLGYDGLIFVLKNNFADYVRNGTGSMGAYTIVQPISVLPSRCTVTSTTTPPPADDCGCPP